MLKRTLQGLIGLQANDGFQGLVNIAGFVGIDLGYNFGIHVDDAAVLTFLLEQSQYLFPQLFCGVCRTCQEAFVTLIGSIVLLDEVTHVNAGFPGTADKAFPCLCCCFCHMKNSFSLKYQQNLV